MAPAPLPPPPRGGGGGLPSPTPGSAAVNAPPLHPWRHPGAPSGPHGGDQHLPPFMVRSFLPTRHATTMRGGRTLGVRSRTAAVAGRTPGVRLRTVSVAGRMVRVRLRTAGVRLRIVVVAGRTATVRGRIVAVRHRILPVARSPVSPNAACAGVAAILIAPSPVIPRTPPHPCFVLFASLPPFAVNESVSVFPVALKLRSRVSELHSRKRARCVLFADAPPSPCCTVVQGVRA